MNQSIEPMPDQKRADRILACVNIFRKGCSIAGPQAYAMDLGPVNPGKCEECLEAFLKEVAEAMAGWSPR